MTDSMIFKIPELLHQIAQIDHDLSVKLMRNIPATFNTCWWDTQSAINMMLKLEKHLERII